MEKIERHIYIAAPSEKVWDALIDPAAASKYFAVPVLELDPRPGGKILYEISGGSRLAYDVLECEPGRRLVHTFHFPWFAEDPPTRVIYEVEAMGEMTKLTLIHDGFPTRNETFKDVDGGWDHILSSLKTLLETGKPLPPPTDHDH